MIIYTVKNGDTIYSIARRNGVSPQILARDNGLKNPRALSVGETLVILQPKSVYTVRRGDSIYTVAQRFGVTVGDLWRNNPFLGGKSELREGEVLTIVPEEPTSERELETNAYVYPNVDRDILRTMLPYLTYLTVFSYGIESDGTLGEVDDEEIVELARQYGAAPIMLLASLGERGTFSRSLAERVLNNEQVRSTLIEEIAMTLARKRYAGVELDFEYVSGADSDAYVSFVRDLKERLSEDGYLVFVSLAPKTSADQRGLLYEGHDYAAMGEVADRVFLMTYEWGYSYGPPMAISPIDKVSEVLDFATGEILPEKILMGIPNYGYNWRLPFVEGERRARSLGNVEAVELAWEKRARIEYDEIAEAPHYRYFDREGSEVQEHEVWFENAKSVQAMLRLADAYDLRGVGVWNGMKYFPQLWQVLNHTVRPRKLWE